MQFFSKLFPSKARIATREKILSLLRIDVRIGRDSFILADYSEKGFACVRVEGDTREIPYEIGETMDADFLILGHKKTSVRIEVRWKKETSFGARLVTLGPYQEFAERFLKNTKVES